MEDVDIVVSGGGLAGLLAAKIMIDLGLRVVVLEKRRINDLIAREGRLLSIAYGHKALLEKCGIWSHIADVAEPILSVRVVDGYSDSHVHFDYDLTDKDAMGYMIPAADLHGALALCVGNNSTIIEDAVGEVSEQDDCSVVISIPEGSRCFKAKLHIFAGGKNSDGVATNDFDYHQKMMTFIINHELNHCGVAVERFLPNGPFAVLPRRGGFSSSIVWTEPHARAIELLAAGHEQFMRELVTRVDYLGDVSIVGKIHGFDISLRYAKNYVSGRTIYFGDAAHALHPLAGQSFNLTLSDVTALMDIVGDALRLGVDIGSSKLLAGYDRGCRLRNSSMIAATDGLNSLFSNSSTVACLARRLGMRIVNRSTFVKKVLALRAMCLA